jgi:hypothetical protein
MLGICLTVGLVIAGQAQTQEKDVKTRPWAVSARRHAMAAKVYATADPAHPFAPKRQVVDLVEVERRDGERARIRAGKSAEAGQNRVRPPRLAGLSVGLLDPAQAAHCPEIMACRYVASGRPSVGNPETGASPASRLASLFRFEGDPRAASRRATKANIAPWRPGPWQRSRPFSGFSWLASGSLLPANGKLARPA